MKYFLGVIALLLILATQCVVSMVQESATYDEPVHLPAGYSYLVTRDFRMNTEHPPLTKMIAASPLLFMNLKSPAEFASWQEMDSFKFGVDFLYRSGQDADKILFWGRFPMMMLSLALGLLILFWTRSIAGPSAGLFSLFLYAFCPNIIAYSRLIVPDIGGAFFMTLAMYFLWRYLEEPRALRLVFVAVGTGLSILSKFNLICLIPAIFVVLFINMRGSISSKAVRGVKTTFAICLIAAVVVWAGYLFEYGPVLGHQAHTTLNLLTRSLPKWAGHAVVFMAEKISIPCPGFFEGLGWLMVPMVTGRDSFLMGQIMRSCPWYGSEVALLLKTPIPLLLLSGCAFYRVARKRLYADQRYYTLLIGVCAILFTDALSRFSLQVKYVIGVYPLLMVLIGITIDWRLLQRRLAKVAFAGLCLWYAAGTVFVFPNYLAYFNELCGGPENGYRYLVDSNLDWGQELKSLKKYIHEKGVGRIWLAYFGTADPGYYGIEYDELPPESPQKGWVAVSATYLQGVHTKRGGYDWLKRYSPCAKIGYSIFVYKII